MKIATKYAILTAVILCISANSDAVAQSFGSPQTKLRPLGSPSAVDQYRHTRTVSRAATQDPGIPGTLQQTAFMQTDTNLSAPPLGMPPNNSMTPPTAGNPGTNGPTAFPTDRMPFNESEPLPAGPGRTLPSPNSTSIASTPSPSDLTAIPRPQLQSQQQYARVDNCRLVTGPSYYQAASPYGCGVTPVTYAPVTQSPYAPPAAEIAAPANIPPASVFPAPPPTIPTTASAPARALVSFGQEQYTVQVGQGLWGQPVAYVPGQGVRNWLRYLSF
ncbi:MAG: hypothetical protein AAFV88_06715 [Planctomycetota bacterium]